MFRSVHPLIRPTLAKVIGWCGVFGWEDLRNPFRDFFISLDVPIIDGQRICRFDELLKEDSEIYRRYYRATTTAVLPSIQALLGRLEQKFDIVHLIVDVTEFSRSP